jgi:hypothetical protein
MINIDNPEFAGGEHDAGPDEAWDIWAKGKMRNRKGYANCVSGGYGQYGYTLVAMIPRAGEKAPDAGSGNSVAPTAAAAAAAAATSGDTFGTPDVVLKDGGVRIYLPKDPANVLGINPMTLLATLREQYPEAPMDHVEKHKAQWTMGSHPALNGRTNQPMPRNKVFAQKGDPRIVGSLQYKYTGKQNRIDLMTCDVGKIPLLETMIQTYDAALPDGVPASNHYITTMYSDGMDCIDPHSDTTTTLDPDSFITVVKLGPGSRKFVIRENIGTQQLGKVLFDEVLPPGTIVQMTIRGNELTTHEVPREPGSTEMSGSVVFRTSALVYPPAEVAKRVASADKNYNTVVRFV